MTATVNDYSLAKNAEPALVSGLGQHHSDRNTAKPQAYLTISLSEIEAMLSIPQQVEKHEAQWFIPSTLKDRNHSNQRNEARDSVLTETWYFYRFFCSLFLHVFYDCLFSGFFQHFNNCGFHLGSIWVPFGIHWAFWSAWEP